MIFSACTALAHYCNVVSNMVEKLALADSGIPRRFMKRLVDDQPTASQASTTRGKDSVNSYKQICKELNLELTQDCQDCDKAVTNSRCGKVLGFWFSTADPNITNS